MLQSERHIRQVLFGITLVLHTAVITASVTRLITRYMRALPLSRFFKLQRPW